MVNIQIRWFGIPDKSMLDSAGTFTTFKHEKYIEDDGNSQDFSTELPRISPPFSFTDFHRHHKTQVEEAMKSEV